MATQFARKLSMTEMRLEALENGLKTQMIDFYFIVISVKTLGVVKHTKGFLLQKQRRPYTVVAFPLVRW